MGGPRGGGGPNSQQEHDVVMTSMRRNDVASTSFRRHVPTRFLINQCQIIIFLNLKSDIIENSRIELRGIVLPAPDMTLDVYCGRKTTIQQICQHLQIKLKLHLLLFYPSTWYICDFFLFHIEIEGKCGWIIGGPKGMLAPPLKLLGGAWPPLAPPLPTPMILSLHLVSIPF